MDWREKGEKPYPNQTWPCLLTHIWVTRLQWVKHVSSRTSGPSADGENTDGTITYAGLSGIVYEALMAEYN